MLWYKRLAKSRDAAGKWLPPCSDGGCESFSTVIANARGGAGVPGRGCARVHAGSFKFKRLGPGLAGLPRKMNERQIVATTGQTVSGVPGRYASALFELASEEKSADAESDVAIFHFHV